VLEAEAVDLAQLLRDTWDGFPGVDGKVVVPGFSGMLKNASVATDLLELVGAIQHADARYRLSKTRGPAPMPEARHVLSELFRHHSALIRRATSAYVSERRSGRRGRRGRGRGWEKGTRPRRRHDWKGFPICAAFRSRRDRA
jgi:hypothetical protein